ncbi:MAG: riboflavin synthase [Vicinamibacterales bacterium]
MFTGLIEAVGVIQETERATSGVRLCVTTGLAPRLTPGDSLAVNGVCLTVTVVEAGSVHADVGPETARITTLGSLERGRLVNLEQPMRADARVGGHFVQGHVDGTGTVEEIRAEGDAHWLTISFPPGLASYLIRKGSIAVDGVSLTVAGLGDAELDVMIVPFTWDHTATRSLRVRDRVNLECDMIGKYVARTLELTGIDAARSRTRVY